MKPKKPKTFKEISPLGEKPPITKIEKSWIIFFSACILVTLDIGLTMALSILFVTLTTFSNMLWKKILTKKSENTA
jgi:hypothetical protein